MSPSTPPILIQDGAQQVVHFAFIVFVAVGGLMAWRWPRLLWLHVPAVACGLGIVTLGYDCPLTPLEKHFGASGRRSGL